MRGGGTGRRREEKSQSRCSPTSKGCASLKAPKLREGMLTHQTGLGLRDMPSLREAQPTLVEPCVIGKGQKLNGNNSSCRIRSRIVCCMAAESLRCYSLLAEGGTHLCRSGAPLKAGRGMEQLARVERHSEGAQRRGRLVTLAG